MSLICHLANHVVALNIQHNQGFAFGKCLRCDHDMIRSAGPRSARRWRKVPQGFRVAHDRRHDRRGSTRPTTGRSLIGDVPRLAGAALWWYVVDALRVKRPRREAMRYLPSNR